MSHGGTFASPREAEYSGIRADVEWEMTKIQVTRPTSVREWEHDTWRDQVLGSLVLSPSDVWIAKVGTGEPREYESRGAAILAIEDHARRVIGWTLLLHEKQYPQLLAEWETLQGMVKKSYQVANGHTAALRRSRDPKEVKSHKVAVRRREMTDWALSMWKHINFGTTLVPVRPEVML